MIQKDDCRIQGQDKYLAGLVLHWKKYKKLRDDWDHDHCSFCQGKFMETGEFLKEGYATQDTRYWICEKCYEDFKTMFKWKINEKLV